MSTPVSGKIPKAALTQDELELLVEQLGTWSGAQFQSITGLQLGDAPEAPQDLIYELHFYLGRARSLGGPRVLILDLDRTSPQLWLLESEAEIQAWQACVRTKRKRPMELFLRSHFIGQRLLSVESRGPGLVTLQFTCESEGLAELELSLRPRASQFLARRRKVGRDLQLTEFKPEASQAWIAAAIQEVGVGALAGNRIFSLHRQRNENFLGSMGAKPNSNLKQDSTQESVQHLGQQIGQHKGRDSSQSTAPGRPTRSAAVGGVEKTATKISHSRSARALGAVRAEIEAKSQVPWRAWAQHVKEIGFEAPPLFANAELERIWNREAQRARVEGIKNHDLASRFFERAKKIERKLEGTRKRLAILEKLAAGETEPPADRGARIRRSSALAGGDAVKRSTPSLMEQAEARGRSVAIAEDLIFYIGKSAEDNLRLLRRAQSFDFWFHVRGRTGAHGILRRARGRVVNESEFLACARALIEQSLKKRALDLRGESFDVSLCEVRFVKPVKGAKGLVHFTHDRTLRIRF